MYMWEGVLIGIVCFALGVILAVVVIDFLTKTGNIKLTKLDEVKHYSLDEMARFLFNVQASGMFANSKYPKTAKAWKDYLNGRN